MANYTCEDDSICTKFQSAICLHCNRRLCLPHLTEHNQMIVSGIKNLSNEVKTSFQQIREKSEKRKNMFNHILTSLNQWRTEQIEKIEQTYGNHLKLIESQREVLEHTELKLFKQLEENVLQPLELIQRQQNANVDIINDIQQTMKKVREDNDRLKWKLITPTPVDIQYSPLNIPSISIPSQSSQSTKKRKISSTHDNEKQSNGHALKKLVTMFSNTSFIKQTKEDIAAYVKVNSSITNKRFQKFFFD